MTYDELMKMSDIVATASSGGVTWGTTPGEWTAWVMHAPVWNGYFITYRFTCQNTHYFLAKPNGYDFSINPREEIRQEKEILFRRTGEVLSLLRPMHVGKTKGLKECLASIIRELE